jgi:hypothetical protein
LLKTARAAELAMLAEHAVAAAFATLDSLAASGAALPMATPQPFGSSWQGLIDQPDRVAAPGCFRAAQEKQADSLRCVRDAFAAAALSLKAAGTLRPPSLSGCFRRKLFNDAAGVRFPPTRLPRQHRLLDKIPRQIS